MLDIEVRGPLFSGNAPAIFEEGVRSAINEAALRGEVLVKGHLWPGHGVRTGHYRRSIHGEMRDSAMGVVHDSNVVYGPWLEGVSSRNERSRFKGYAMFRLGAQQLERDVSAIGRKWAAWIAERLG